MRPLFVLALVTLAGVAGAETTHLTAEEYQRLPKLVALDNYADCLGPAGGAFCLASFRLSAPAPSPLYEVLKNISSFSRVYFDHTLLHRGVCVTSSCRRFLASPSRELATLAPALEACVNRSVHRQYGLEARVAELVYCKRSGESTPLDKSDYLFAAVVVILLLLNVAGTVYEAWVPRDAEGRLAWLAAFSLRVNWNKLTVLRDDDYGDPRLDNLKAMQGLRTMGMCFVILCHVILIPIFTLPPGNSEVIEQLPSYKLASLFYNGMLSMQITMVMASFLVAYNLSIYMETKSKFSWKMLLLGSLTRFLRLIPSYLLVVSFSATWAPRLTSGPLCACLEQERNTCRRKWWAHLFFLNNVVDASNFCVVQTWYLAVDMQLFVIGLLLLKLLWARRHLARPVLGSALALATLAQILFTYFLELRPPVFMHTPESVRSAYKIERSFRLLYTTVVGNIQGYLVGLLLGLEYYRLETHGDDITNTRWFRWVYRLSVPATLVWMVAVYPYLTTDHPQLYLSLYSAVDRLFFAGLVAVLLLGTFRRVDSGYRGLLAWRGWQATGRLTFGALLLHILVHTYLFCSREYAWTVTAYGTLFDWVGTVVVTYLLAVPLALLVEYPAQALTKALLAPAPRPQRAARNGTLGGSNTGHSNGVKKTE